jgi:hypothetical protein
MATAAVQLQLQLLFMLLIRLFLTLQLLFMLHVRFSPVTANRSTTAAACCLAPLYTAAVLLPLLLLCCCCCYAATLTGSPVTGSCAFCAAASTMFATASRALLDTWHDAFCSGRE